MTSGPRREWHVALVALRAVTLIAASVALILVALPAALVAAGQSVAIGS